MQDSATNVFRHAFCFSVVVFFFGKGDYAMYQTESSEYTRYAIKQWSVKGGRLLVLITPIHGMTGSLGLSYHTLL